MTSLQEAKRRLEIAHENYRVQPDGKRWQKFNAALKSYIDALDGEEKKGQPISLPANRETTLKSRLFFTHD
jgi:hypothetical protein